MGALVAIGFFGCLFIYVIARFYMCLIDILIPYYFRKRNKIQISSKPLSIVFTIVTFTLWVVAMPFALVASCFFIVKIFT